MSSALDRLRKQVRAISALAAAQRLDVRDHSMAGLPPKPTLEEQKETDAATVLVNETIRSFAGSKADFDDGFRNLGDAAQDARCLGWFRISEFFGEGTSLAGDKFDPLSLQQGACDLRWLAALYGRG